MSDMSVGGSSPIHGPQPESSQPLSDAPPLSGQGKTIAQGILDLAYQMEAAYKNGEPVTTFENFRAQLNYFIKRATGSDNAFGNTGLSYIISSEVKSGANTPNPGKTFSWMMDNGVNQWQPDDPHFTQHYAHFAQDIISMFKQAYPDLQGSDSPKAIALAGAEIFNSEWVAPASASTMATTVQQYYHYSYLISQFASFVPDLNTINPNLGAGITQANNFMNIFSGNNKNALYIDNSADNQNARFFEIVLNSGALDYLVGNLPDKIGGSAPIPVAGHPAETTVGVDSILKFAGKYPNQSGQDFEKNAQSNLTNFLYSFIANYPFNELNHTDSPDYQTFMDPLRAAMPLLDAAGAVLIGGPRWVDVVSFYQSLLGQPSETGGRPLNTFAQTLNVFLNKEWPLT